MTKHLLTVHLDLRPDTLIKVWIRRNIGIQKANPITIRSLEMLCLSNPGQPMSEKGSSVWSGLDHIHCATRLYQPRMFSEWVIDFPAIDVY